MQLAIAPVQLATGPQEAYQHAEVCSVAETLVHTLGVTTEHFQLEQDSLGCSLPEKCRASCYFSGVHEDKAILSELADTRIP